MSRRTERINVLLREELSWTLARDMKDPRLSALVSITHVEISADLRQAVVHISVLGTAEEKQTTRETLQAAAGFLQKQLKPKLDMRYVPYLTFKLDDSIEQGMHMQHLLDAVQPAKETKA